MRHELKRLALIASFILGILALSLFKAPAAQAEDDLLLLESAVGAACGLMLYNSHIIVGMAADAYASETYTAEEAVQIVDEQVGGLGAAIDQIDALLDKSSLPESEKASLRDIKEAAGMINEAIDALKAFIDNPGDETAASFQEKRIASYDNLAKLLGFDEPAAGEQVEGEEELGE